MARRADTPKIELTPGARRFLAQRKAQGIEGVTQEQADRLARLLRPVPKSSGASAPASDAPRTVVGPRGEIEEAS